MRQLSWSAHRRVIRHEHRRAVAPRHPARAAARASLRGIPLLVVGLFAADALLVLAHAINSTLIAAVDRPRSMFDLDDEANLPTWYSSMQMALLGALLVVLAYARRRPRQVGWWAMLGVAALPLYLSIDEFVQLHERLGRLVPSDVLPATGLWMAIAVPALIAALVLLYIPSAPFWSGPRAARVRVVLGVVVYLASAAGVEVAINFAATDGVAGGALVIAEEGGELVGVTLMIWGVVELLSASRVRLIVPDPRRSESQWRGGHRP